MKKFHKELEDTKGGLDRVSPMILPDYTPEEVKKKQWSVKYEGSIR